MPFRCWKPITVVFLKGGADNFGPGGSLWLIRTDAEDDSLWTRTFGGPSEPLRSIPESDFVIRGVEIHASLPIPCDDFGI